MSEKFQQLSPADLRQPFSQINHHEQLSTPKKQLDTEIINDNEQKNQLPRVLRHRPRIMNRLRETFCREVETLKTIAETTQNNTDKEYQLIHNRDTGNYIITYHRDRITSEYFVTKSRREALDKIKELSRELEKINSQPILEFSAQNVTYAFTKLENYHPRTARTDKAYDYHQNPVLERLLSEKNVKKSFRETYYRTLEIPDWNEQVYALITNFIHTNEDMQDLMKKHQIKNLKDLSPKQVIYLTTTIVKILTKYDEIEKEKQTRVYDHQTVMQLLQAGIDNHNNPDWVGNGVCRHFADITQIVFESFKAHQIKLSQLNNMYCLYRLGGKWIYSPHKDESLKSYQTHHDASSHAWNDFIVIAHDGSQVDSINLDVTWADYDLEQRQLLNVDKTHTRIRKYLQETLDLTDLDNKNRILSYYQQQILRKTPQNANENQLYLSEALHIARAIMQELVDSNHHSRKPTKLKPKQLDNVADIIARTWENPINSQELNATDLQLIYSLKELKNHPQLEKELSFIINDTVENNIKRQLTTKDGQPKAHAYLIIAKILKDFLAIPHLEFQEKLLQILCHKPESWHKGIKAAYNANVIKNLRRLCKGDKKVFQQKFGQLLHQHDLYPEETSTGTKYYWSVI